jgi:predicted NUDIX family NTP pyrophosphohydrolase
MPAAVARTKLAKGQVPFLEALVEMVRKTEEVSEG